MKRALTYLVLLSGAAFAQSTATAPKFSVADVHPSPPSSMPVVKGPFYGDNRYELRYATMVDLIHTAYGMDPERVYGGPSWLEFYRFDILAIAPPGSTPESRKLMLQSLLADRFKLVFRRDMHPLPAYALSLAKGGAKLKEADGSGEHGCKTLADTQQRIDAAQAQLAADPEILDQGPGNPDQGVFPQARRQDPDSRPVRRRLQDGRLVEDNVPEDMSLVIDTDKGLVVLAGCGHAGIVNTLEYARRQVRETQVHAALGGFHLFEADAATLDWTAAKLRSFGVGNLLGAHCTGIEAVFGLRQRLGLTRATCAVGAVGARFSLEAGIDPGLIAR